MNPDVRTNDSDCVVSAPVPTGRKVIGWVAVVVSTAAACNWAYWGSIETFHEGWYFGSLPKNIVLSLGQYMSPSLVFILAACIGIRWPRIGGALHIAAAAVAAYFFRGAAFIVLIPFIVGPLVLMGIAYWTGRPQPRRGATMLVVCVPLILAVIAGSGPAYRVSQRIDDGNRSARHIAQNGVDLVWAPEGPGWPLDGTSWEEAKRRCALLKEDGLSLADTPQNIWRLPTVDEAARSMQRHGQNSEGAWDAATRKTAYRITPDKESPLWNTRSKVIYWWTADAVDDKRAYMIVYDGQVWPRPKDANWAYLGYRAVKNATAK